MKSFFSRIQGKFSAEYSGRFLSTIIEEVSHSSNIIAAVLLSERNTKGYRISAEYRFDGVDKKNRYADLAIFDDSNKLVMLVEIKYRDHKSKENHAQIKDYLKFCKKNNIQFLCLSAFHLGSEDRNLITDNQFMLFTDFSNELLKKGKNCSEINLLISYLYEQGLVMKEIKEDLVVKMMLRFFRSRKGIGGKDHKNSEVIEGIPDVLSSLMKNLELISYEIQALIGNARASNIAFYLEPTYKISKTSIKDWEIQEKSYTFTPDSNQKAGGILYISSSNSIKKRNEKGNDYLYLNFGFAIEIGGSSKELKSSFWTEITTYKNDDYYYEEKDLSLKNFSDRSKSINHFREMIKLTCDDVVKNFDKTCLSKADLNRLEEIGKSVQV